MLNFVFIIPTATFLVDKSQLVIKSITIIFVNVLAHDKGHVSCSPYPDPFAQNNTNISWKIRLDLVRQAQDFSFSLWVIISHKWLKLSEIFRDCTLSLTISATYKETKLIRRLWNQFYKSSLHYNLFVSV